MRDLLGNARHRPLPLSDRGQRVLRARIAAVLREFAVRHHARAQRQPDQQRGAEARALPARFPPRQHQFRLRGAAQRAGARARARGASCAGSTRTRSSRAVAGVHKRCRGAYAIVAMIAGYGLLAFRDPFGIRPLIIGVNEAMGGTEYRRRERVGRARGARLSTCCATSRRARRSSSTRPARFHARQCADNPVARAVHLRVRLPRAARFGDRRHVGVRVAPQHGRAARASKIRGMPEAQDIDVVIPIPDSSRPSALQLANTLGPHVSRGLRQEPLHRPHVHHAGTGAAQEERAPEAEPDRHGVQGQGRAARRRFDRPRHDVARDRADGARSRRAQGVLRLGEPAGALSRTSTASTCRTSTSSSPPAAPRPRSRARSAPTSSIYQDLDALKAAVRAANPRLTEFEASCFDGKYITGDVTADYLSQLAAVRDIGRGEIDADAERARAACRRETSAAGWNPDCVQLIWRRPPCSRPPPSRRHPDSDTLPPFGGIAPLPLMRGRMEGVDAES